MICQNRLSISPFTVCCSLLAFLFILACGRPAGFGLRGHYLDAQAEVTKPRGADIDKAIALLENVVKEDPLYKDSLTLLGRAYYRKGRYQDALQILKRALAVNKEDEIAWITLGLTQLRLGDDEKGLESLKGGITLFANASRGGYHGLERWDINGVVRGALRREVLLVTKGLEEKERIIREGELLLARIDDELYRGEREKFLKEENP